MIESILIINGVDYTENIRDRRKHNLNRTRVTKTWIDADYTIHTDVPRKQISGSTVLTFQGRDEFQDFVENVRDIDNAIIAYVDNVGDVVEFTGNIDYTAKSTWLADDSDVAFIVAAVEIGEK